MLKNIVKNLKPSSTLKINETSREMENKGKKVFKFGFGQSPFQVPSDIVNELKNNAFQNKYLPMQGLKSLREVVAQHTSKKKNMIIILKMLLLALVQKSLCFYSMCFLKER